MLLQIKSSTLHLAAIVGRGERERKRGKEGEREVGGGSPLDSEVEVTTTVRLCAAHIVTFKRICNSAEGSYYFTN